MILTREEIQQRLKFSEGETEYFLDLCSKVNSPFYQVIKVPDDRFLILEDAYWQDLMNLTPTYWRENWSFEIESD